MVNGWKEPNGESGIKQQSTPAELGTGPLAFLPSYNKLMHPLETQQESSAPNKAPVPIIPLALPVPAPTRKQSAQKMTGPTDKSKTVPKLSPKASSTVDSKEPQTTAPKYTDQEISNTHSFYEKFKRMVEPYLTTCGGTSDVRKNVCINHAYYQAGIVNPYLLWPMAAVLGSAKVGQNIALTQQMDVLTFGMNAEIHELGIQLPVGNQAIFKDVMPLWMLYKKEGYAGIERIKETLKENYKKSYGAILSAFRNQEILDGKVKDLAFSMGLPANSPEVMNKFFADPSNRKMALDISMDLVYHEQKIVQKIYTNPVNTALTNPANIAMGSFLHLDGVTVNGKRFSFAEWVKDPSNFEQRMAYFRAIFTEISNLHAHPTQIQAYQEQAHKALIFSAHQAVPVSATPQGGALPSQNAANDFKIQATDFIHSAEGKKSKRFKK
jgi:hypothetical protein